MSDHLLKECSGGKWSDSCGETKGETKWINGVEVIKCALCGVHRQVLRMTEDELGEFYENYESEHYQHSLEHDKEVADIRAKKYGANCWSRSHKILDVGCGNGAWVEYLVRGLGLDAYGQSIGKPEADIPKYLKPLHECHFPTDYFDIVTCFDVLEHVIDPRSFLAEMLRILKPGGEIIIEFPDFWAEDGSGDHHWKKIEHLWMLDRLQLLALINSVDKDEHIKKTHVREAIPGKYSVTLTKGSEIKRSTILVPPGVGDILWVMTKMRSFCKSNDIGIPEVWVDCPDGRERSMEFVQSIPFVAWGGYLREFTEWRKGDMMKGWHKRNMKEYWSPERVEAYRMPGRSIFENVNGKDWFISFNGRIDHGDSLNDIHPELEVDWDIPMFEAPGETLWADKELNVMGDYVVASFFSSGFYGKWIEDLGLDFIVEILAAMQSSQSLRIVLCGADWDENSLINKRLIRADEDGVIFADNLIGETAFSEYMALLRRAKYCIGFPAGNTMLGPQMGVPTTLFWNKHFPEAMWQNSVRPDHNGTYNIVDTSMPKADIRRSILKHLEESYAG